MSESMLEFQMVLKELVGDESMDKVRVEYEKLIHALKKSRENERRLMSRCRELNAEIVSTSTKVAAALKLSQEDETTITSLKRVCSQNMCLRFSEAREYFYSSRSWLWQGIERNWTWLCLSLKIFRLSSH